MREFREIAVRLLDKGEHENRFDYEGPEMEELVASVRLDGVLVPLIVRPVGDRFVVIEGHRRREAALRVGLDAVPCQVQSGDAGLAKRTAFLGNIVRKDLTPVELAVAVAKAVQDGEASVEEFARSMHRSVDWVRRQVALLDWPEDVLQAIHGGSLSVAAAANLAGVGDDAYRGFLLENAVANGATARTTAAWLQAWRATLPVELAVQQPAVAGAAGPGPVIPQAPCLCCGDMLRTDELSHVPLCARCIPRVRRLGEGG